MSGFIVIVLLIKWLKVKHVKTFDIVLSVAILVLLYFAEVYFDDLFAELMFGIPSIQNPLSESFFTGLFKSFFKLKTLPLSSAPSGFVFRQSLIVLTGLFILESKNLTLRWGKLKRDAHKQLTLNPIFEIGLIASLIYISFARIARLVHTPLDIAIGLALGTLVFWVGVYILTFTFNIEIEERYKTTYTLTIFILAMIPLFLSQKPDLWMILIVASIFSMWFTKTIVEIFRERFTKSTLENLRGAFRVKKPLRRR